MDFLQKALVSQSDNKQTNWILGWQANYLLELLSKGSSTHIFSDDKLFLERRTCILRTVRHICLELLSKRNSTHFFSDNILSSKEGWVTGESKSYRWTILNRKFSTSSSILYYMKTVYYNLTGDVFDWNMIGHVSQGSTPILQWQWTVSRKPEMWKSQILNFFIFKSICVT